MKNEIKEFTERGIKIAETLMKEGKYLDSLQACKEILQVDPDNAKTNQIIAEIGDRMFKKNFPLLKDLYKKGHYEEAIAAGEKIGIIIRNNHLSKFIAKCKSKLAKKQNQEIGIYLRNGIKNHKSLAKKKDWLSAIAILTELQSVDPRNEKIREMLKNDRIKYIDNQLHSDIKQNLLKEKKYEELYGFYRNLFAVFPEYKKLKNEMQKLEEEIDKKNQETKSAYTEENLKKIKTMLENKQFEDAVKASQETVITTKFKNKKAITAYKKAIASNEADTDRKLTGMIDKIITDLKADSLANPENFIRI